MITSKVIFKGAKLLKGRMAFALKKSAPDILIFGGCGCVLVGAGFVAKGTLDAVKIKEEFDEKEEKIKASCSEDKKKEEVKAIGNCAWKMFKAFAPAIILTTSGVTMILCGRGMMKARYAALSTMYAALNETLEKYRKRVADKISIDEERDIYEDVEREVITEGKGKNKQTTELMTINGSGHPLEFLFDERNLKYKKYKGNNWFVLMRCREQCNNILNAKGYLMLNEVLEILGMPVTSYSFYVGWTYDPQNNNKVQFGIEDDDELKYSTNQCILLRFNCDGNILDQISTIENYRYGYRCDID